MLNNIDDTFTADKEEDFVLKGNYKIKTFYNGCDDLGSLQEVEDYHCKAVFHKGNVLYKEDEPKILEYINLIIKWTYTKPDMQVEKKKEQRRSGTICPTRENIYEIDDKIFTLYGRYIYGFDDFDKVTFKGKSSKKKFLLKRAARVEEEPVNKFLYDHSYAFKIVDKNTNVLYAFGLYR